MAEVAADIVIVGSGAGGGTVAKELAPLCADGIRIVLFEQGPRLRDEEFTGREVEMARRLYADSGGMLTRNGCMTLASGCAYGGSTVVYTGTSLTVPETVIRRWNVPGLDWHDVRNRSEKYALENGVQLLDESLHNDNNRLFVEGCRRLGWSVRQFPINVAGCRGSGLCNLGCPNGAKQGTHRVQLPAAEAAGVEVVTNARVESVRARECRVVVGERGFGEPSRWALGEYRVRAKLVVVAGNAVNSPALLLRSGFGDRLPALGRYLTLHPALILAGEHDRPITNFVGHPKSFYCDEHVESGRFLLESCMYFPFTTAKNLIGFGAEHALLMSGFERMQQVLVLALDEARGVHVPAAERFLLGRDDLDRLEELVPRSRVAPGRISVTSAHLMGGCRMGADERSSVTDAWGRVHGVPWLFVADSSLFPRCSEVNPYLTVMALAGRVAERVHATYKELSP